MTNDPTERCFISLVIQEIPSQSKMPSHIHQLAKLLLTKPSLSKNAATLEFSFLYERGKGESYNTELTPRPPGMFNGPLGDELPVRVSLRKGTTPCNFS